MSEKGDEVAELVKQCDTMKESFTKTVSFFADTSQSPDEFFGIIDQFINAWAKESTGASEAGKKGALDGIVAALKEGGFQFRRKGIST